MKQLKLFLSLVLTVSIVLTAILPVWATDGESTSEGGAATAQSQPIYEIPDGATTYKIDGVTYYVIRDLETLQKYFNTDYYDNYDSRWKNFILANDIDCKGATLIDNYGQSRLFEYPGMTEDNLDNAVIFHGNGCALTGIDIESSTSVLSVFGGADKKGGKSYGGMTYRDLNIGTKDQPAKITSTATGTGVFVGALCGYINASATILNVNVYANITVKSTSAIVGGFIGGIRWGDNVNHRVSMTNCVFDGTIKAAENVTPIAFGGIIGEPQTCSISLTLTGCTTNGTLEGAAYCGGMAGKFTGRCPLIFDRCVNNAVIRSAKLNADQTASGGMIGWSQSTERDTTNSLEGTIFIRNCVNNGAFSNSMTYGGMIGLSKNDWPVIMDNCVNNQDLTAAKDSNGDANVGGMIGWIKWGGNATYTLKGCVNKGTLRSDGNHMGGMIGYCSADCTEVFIGDCRNYGNIESGQWCHGGMIGKWKSPVKGNSLSINNCMNYGTVKGKNIGTVIGELLSPGNSVNTSNVTIQNFLQFGIMTALDGTGTTIGANSSGCYEVSEENIHTVPSQSVETALDDLNGNGAVTGAFGRFVVDKDGFVIPATPTLEGVQKEITNDSNFDIRLVASIGNTLEYSQVGFRISKVGSEKPETVKNCSTVYNAVIEVVNGIERAFTATECGAEYLYALTVEGIPVQAEEVKLTITPYAKSLDGNTEYVFDSYTIVITNGVIAFG